MARPAAIDDQTLMARLAAVFRRGGYEGASMASLAEGTGLKKASLYHRFPGGKEEMAGAVLGAEAERFGAEALGQLEGPGPVNRRITAFVEAVKAHYAGGRAACLLNLFAPPMGESGPFGAPIAGTFALISDRLAQTLEEGGADPARAAAEAEQFLAAVHGGLVLARGCGGPDAFVRIVDRAAQALASAPRRRSADMERLFPRLA